ncbi:hypothetical protein DKL61_06715 [Gammaproteobacteria bacterium ESL0073]|nr:hypothetical protein DKL61_06715 [Gammaproteobacteria bacterium ESL0073]
MIKYGSARQAWHDAYYTGKENTVDQFLLLGTTVQKTVVNNSLMLCMDAWLKSRVQNEISTLPENIQGFGNWMYSPMRNIDDLEGAQEAVFDNFWYNFKAEKLTDKKWQSSKELTLCAILEYFHVIMGNPKPFKTHADKCKLLVDERGVKIDNRNWDIYNALLNSCAYIDAKALEPVSKIIKLEYDKVA